MDYPPDWMLNTSTPLPSPDLNNTQLQALANYYYKYYQEMKEEGVEVEFISLFNELTDSYMNASYSNVRNLLVDYVGPMFRKFTDVKSTWTAKFGRRKTAEASPEFLEMDGVEDYVDVIFYHGYDCNDGPAEGLGWQCEGLNTTCPYLKSAVGELKLFGDKYAKGKKMWMTEVCYASEFTDYDPALTGCPDLPRLDFDDAMQWYVIRNTCALVFSFLICIYNFILYNL